MLQASQCGISPSISSNIGLSLLVVPALIVDQQTRRCRISCKVRCLRHCLLWQAEHLQVLLKAPGIRPTAMCLIRDGDLDWLSFPQFHSVLLSDFAATSLHSRLRSPKGAGT